MKFPHRSGRQRRWLAISAVLATAALALTGCSPSGSSKTDIVVAIVANPQMKDAISLQDDFRKAHPDVNVRFVSLPENEARAKITASVATGGSEFDVVMISNYETQMWAKNGWITDLQPYADKTSGYDPNDFIPTIKDALSYQNDLYSVPFYGESSFVAYRKDLFEKAGLTMPAHPTWDDLKGFAAKLDDKKSDFAGICLRGLAGWGEVMAPLDTMINTYGGQWFDQNWNAKLNSPQVESAVSDYVSLLNNYGQPGAATSGYGDCITRYSQGKAAMWYDATAMVSSVEDPKSSKVAGQTAYAPAPVKDTKSAGWLYSWSLAIPKTSQHKDAAWDFVSWMTSKDYIKLVGNQIGWERVPPGSRKSTYQIPQYAQVAKAYAQPTLDAMNNASQANSMVQKVPYPGLQFVGIPEFQDLGTQVAQQISAAIAGQKSVKDALEQAQQYAQVVAESYQSGANGTESSK
ncbi:sorbitol/mannitol transport system substrate-binding protein [Psychromicrobium silvestre]|uniref:Sorbitol/mannitol transport system substrate-binding protein n=1 Tax=Psychromicrobium silvestre TaxID=1645614 RepID=A0A7Y9S954_9MICC|nr:sugar ABC transporter substrate-binding protein [Psychromicrobium silvestre]NYE96007.1 sorbitol/mannitol transport system substrate-binding protein [Psychromicrobium silvestre]